ncbi:G-protein beta WD-40 repeat protein, partial [Reticulomyxa filosa]
VKHYKLLKEFKLNSLSISSIKFSPNEKKIVISSSDNKIRILDIISEKEIKILNECEHYIYNGKFSPNGNILIYCCIDNTIRLYDIKSGKEIGILKGHLSYITKAEFSYNEKNIISGSWDNTIRLWDFNNKKEINKIEENLSLINDVEFSYNNKYIISYIIWKSRFSFNNLFIASCSKDQTIRLWDIKTGKQIQLLQGHSNNIHNISFSSNNQNIISCSYDKTIRIWDIQSGKQIQLLQHPNIITDLIYYQIMILLYLLVLINVLDYGDKFFLFSISFNINNIIYRHHFI